MKRTLQTILVLAGCTLASGAWAAGPDNHEGVTKADVAHIFAPRESDKFTIWVSR